jgi:hypothetical protein
MNEVIEKEIVEVNGQPFHVEYKAIKIGLATPELIELDIVKQKIKKYIRLCLDKSFDPRPSLNELDENSYKYISKIIKIMKNDLKNHAKLIHYSYNNYRDNQQHISSYKMSKFYTEYSLESTLKYSMSDYHKHLNELKYKYRCAHILYSILRGKTIEDIEQTNKFNRDIDRIKLYEDVVNTFKTIFYNLYVRELCAEYIAKEILNSNEESICEP